MRGPSSAGAGVLEVAHVEASRCSVTVEAVKQKGRARSPPLARHFNAHAARPVYRLKYMSYSTGWVVMRKRVTSSDFSAMYASIMSLVNTPPRVRNSRSLSR